MLYLMNLFRQDLGMLCKGEPLWGGLDLKPGWRQTPTTIPVPLCIFTWLPAAYLCGIWLQHLSHWQRNPTSEAGEFCKLTPGAVFGVWKRYLIPLQCDVGYAKIMQLLCKLTVKWVINSEILEAYWSNHNSYVSAFHVPCHLSVSRKRNRCEHDTLCKIKYAQRTGREMWPSIWTLVWLDSQGTVPDPLFVWYNFTYLCKTSWEKESEDVGDFIHQCFDDLICAIEKTAILFNVAEQCKTRPLKIRSKSFWP